MNLHITFDEVSLKVEIGAEYIARLNYLAGEGDTGLGAALLANDWTNEHFGRNINHVGDTMPTDGDWRTCPNQDWLSIRGQVEGQLRREVHRLQGRQHAIKL